MAFVDAKLLLTEKCLCEKQFRARVFSAVLIFVGQICNLVVSVFKMLTPFCWPQVQKLRFNVNGFLTYSAM